MRRTRAESFVRDLIPHMDIKIDGDRPWDLVVHNPDFYSRVLRQQALGLGESYMDGWWDCDSIDGLLYRILTSDVESRLGGSWPSHILLLTETLFNRQRRSKSTDVAEHHYNLGNDLYTAMLDKRMVYTCAFWDGATNLDEAQENKLDLTCRKIGLETGMTVLDIGCGWGSFAKFAAERYGVSVVGVTNAREQVELARSLCAGLPVEIQLRDYRDIEGEYDRIVSIGMFEAVGPKNYALFMRTVSRCLRDEGLFLLHTIGGSMPRRTRDAWTDKYIFPGGAQPTIAQIGKSIEGVFEMEDWQNLSANYDRTLMSWFENFDRNWESLQPTYGDRFYRMWKYYLLSCAGSFRARRNQLWQIVLSPKGVPGGYKSIR